MIDFVFPSLRVTESLDAFRCRSPPCRPPGVIVVEMGIEVSALEEAEAEGHGRDCVVEGVLDNVGDGTGVSDLVVERSLVTGSVGTESVTGGVDDCVGVRAGEIVRSWVID